MNDDLLKKAYINAFGINDKYIKDMIIINTKSLIDDISQRYVKIDKNRLKDELLYYKFYGAKVKDLNILNILLPIIISNTNMKRSEEQALKVIKYYVLYNKNEEYMNDFIIATLMYNTLLHSIIENPSLEYIDLMKNIKTNIIEFIHDIPKSQVIKFEMKRIESIQLIDKYIDKEVMDYKENSIIVNLLNVVYDIYEEDRHSEIDGIKSIKKSILSMLKFELEPNLDNIDFINSMSDYILKLRKYKVHKKLYDIESDPRYLIGLEIGESKSDPILNNIKVISKEFSNNILTIELISKSGNYKFRFKKA